MAPSLVPPPLHPLVAGPLPHHPAHPRCPYHPGPCSSLCPEHSPLPWNGGHVDTPLLPQASPAGCRPAPRPACGEPWSQGG